MCGNGGRSTRFRRNEERLPRLCVPTGTGWLAWRIAAAGRNDGPEHCPAGQGLLMHSISGTTTLKSGGTKSGTRGGKRRKERRNGKRKLAGQLCFRIHSSGCCEGSVPPCVPSGGRSRPPLVPPVDSGPIPHSRSGSDAHRSGPAPLRRDEVPPHGLDLGGARSAPARQARRTRSGPCLSRSARSITVDAVSVLCAVYGIGTASSVPPVVGLGIGSGPASGCSGSPGWSGLRMDWAAVSTTCCH